MSLLILPRLRGPPKAVEGALRSQTWIESTFIPARSRKELLRINGITAGAKNLRTHFCSHILSFAHNPSIALAGTGSGPGIGRAVVTSPRGFGSHGPEGVRRAGVPAAGANAWAAGLRSSRACDHETSVCNPRGSMETACDRPTGRQTPDGRAWECLFLSYEFVRRFPARPSSLLLNGQTRERAWR
jgi:hypothetical protein